MQVRVVFKCDYRKFLQMLYFEYYHVAKNVQKSGISESSAIYILYACMYGNFIVCFLFYIE